MQFACQVTMQQGAAVQARSVSVSACVCVLSSNFIVQLFCMTFCKDTETCRLHNRLQITYHYTISTACDCIS